MVRAIVLAVVAVIIGYAVGVKAGFSAGVRDYIDNDGEMLERVAVESNKFDYPTTEDEARSIVEDAVQESNQSSGRSFQ